LICRIVVSLPSLALQPSSDEPVTSLAPESVIEALQRIRPHVHFTPLMGSALLDKWLGHEIVFKAEGFQRIGAFKIRGALNALLVLKEQNKLPQEVVAFSSGNHAQAVALAAQMLDIKATVIMPEFVSKVKQQATRSYGANVIMTQTRQEAEKAAAEAAARGAFLLHPSADDHVIAGQGTACYEALQDGIAADAIFAACGGGGLISGTWLAAQLLKPKAKIFAAEPKIANDAAESCRQGKIMGFSDTPMSIADGARTLHISPLTFQYLQKLDGIYEVEEERIIYWTQWLQHLLKITVEPTAAMAMAAAYDWLKTQTTRQHVLVILSGGNVGAVAHRQIWETDYLNQPPSL
jgi:threo-3-hydroxy-L-aspartate ammonia-lyase